MRTLTLVLALLIPATALADAWDALRQPGSVAIMRHALAPGTGDPANMQIDDCTTQRNLDARGRAQARRIGAAFREQGIVFDRILTSQWCRCRDTAAELGLGAPQDAPPLNSFFADGSTRDAQTAATRDLIAAAEDKLLLVTHQVNISALTGRGTRSGEVLVIRQTGDDIEVLGAILIDP